MVQQAGAGQGAERSAGGQGEVYHHRGDSPGRVGVADLVE